MKIILNRKDWKRFQRLLNRPARVPKGLRKLFAKPTVFVDPQDLEDARRDPKVRKTLEKADEFYKNSENI